MNHIYCVPGLAASKEIFKNIKLPEEQYTIHILEWLIPKDRESISEYANRMASCIKHENVILIGVSFGGIIAQEMAAFINLQKLIIISSIKSKQELPRRLKLVKSTKVYKLMPTGLVSSVSDFTKFAIGPRSKKRLNLYNEYLSVRDKQYLNWAIHQVVSWDRTHVDPAVIHIHGDQDAVFPIRNINGAQILEGGTHVMILNKGSRISKMLLNIIENN